MYIVILKFPNSPEVEKFTVMGAVIVVEYLEVEFAFVIYLHVYYYQ